MVEEDDDVRGRFSCARPAPCTEASNCLPVGASLALARGRTCTAASKQSQSQRTERRETICQKDALFDLLQLLIERLDERELSGLQGRQDLVQMRRRFGRRFGCCQGKVKLISEDSPGLHTKRLTRPCRFAQKLQNSGPRWSRGTDVTEDG